MKKSDGPVLEELYHKSKDNGVTIEAIVGDRAYSGKDNMQFTKKERVH
ncbi:degenerate transposase [Streptococcus pneumoniae]|nr:degenerate transposase [Streptococcus pneumoniae]